MSKNLKKRGIGGGDDVAKKKEVKDINPNASRNTVQYWSRVKEVIDAAGDYSWAIKLEANLLDPSTRFKVEQVFQKYFHSSMKELKDSIAVRHKQFFGKVVKLNIVCRQNNLTEITKPERLLNLLLDDGTRESFKGKLETKVKKDQVCSLQEFIK